ncbi:histidine triad nucleotide-binding protein [Microaerobacter geothermalis]|uniref:histidine triad nucleotide-binding protein n=1 Tax=Microaerobacter geothermalis TaxID=674972 RepID=UPI001F41B8E4|nr:histidine triad nucleotide-binding protein [Microaerobacter geothermalis]MCF6092838.1 histidine triad nucleotide-binding protein [Microaerobacter geothermalis]
MRDCIFCKIVAGEIPSQKIYEDDDVMAFYDIHPKADVHFLVIPKKHIPTYMDVEEQDLPLMGKIHSTVQKLARELELKGFRVINNCGKEGGQEVFHIHFHVLSGGKLGTPGQG